MHNSALLGKQKSMALFGVDPTAALISAAKYLKSGAANTHPLLSAESVMALKNKTIQLDLISLDPLPTDHAIALPSRFIFRNTPDELSISRPSRTGVTQTKGGVWIEDFGIGVQELSIQGTTGYKKLMVGKGKNRVEKDGRQSIRDLQDLYVNYNLLRQGQAMSGKDFRGIVMVFHMFSENFHYVVHPVSSTIKRSKSNPLLYFYAMNFIILGAYSDFNTASRDQVMYMLNTPEARFNQLLQNLKDYGDVVYTECLKFNQFPEIKELSDMLSWTNAAITDFKMYYILQQINNPSLAGVVGDYFGTVLTNEGSVVFGYNLNLDHINTMYNTCIKVTDVALVAGAAAYDLIHGLRKLEACLKTLQKVNIIKPIEDDWKNLTNTFEDSGCATTLRQ